MIEQISYNSVLYLLGYLFLRIGFCMPGYLRHISAYFAGIALWAIISTILIVVSVPLQFITILIAHLVFFSILLAVRRQAFICAAHNSKKGVTSFLFYFLIFIIFNIIIFYCSVTDISPDSIKYMGLGVVISRSGYFPPAGYLYPVIESAHYAMNSIHYFLACRMSFLALLSTGSQFFNIGFYNTIFPLSALYFLFLFAALFRIASKPLALANKTRFFLGICGAAMIVSVPAYWYHAYYVNNNLFTSIYFTISLISIYIYKTERKTGWLMVSAIALACTVLQRTEMTVFSLIPLVMLVSIDDLDTQDYGRFLLIFLAVSLGWHSYRLSYLGLNKNVHDWGAIHLLVLVFWLISYFLLYSKSLRDKITRNAPYILMLGLIIFILIRFFRGYDSMMSSIVDLRRIIFASQGVHSWGSIWVLLAAIIPVDIFFLKAKDSFFWIKVIALFYLFRIIFYSTGLFIPATQSQFQSGSRILIHIMPAGVIYIFLLVGHMCRGTRGQAQSRFSNSNSF